MKPGLILLLLLLSLPLGAAQLQLKSQIFRGQLPLTIGDLFEVEGGNAKAIAELPVGWHSADGWNTVEAVVKAARDGGFKIEVNGAQRVWLSLCESIEQSVLSEQVRQALAGQLDKSKIRVTDLTLLSQKSLCLTPGSTIVKTSVDFNRQMPKRLQSSHTLNDGKTVRLWWQSEVEVFTPVSKVAIAKGELLDGKIRLAWVNSRELSGGLLTQTDMTRLKAKRNIASQVAINQSSIEQINDIEPGQAVKLILANGAITIESPAKALDSGNVDDVIRVLVQRASAPVKGKIVNKGVVYAQD